MTPRQRIVLLAIAAVVLVGGIALAASSGGEDEGSQAQTTTPAAAQTQPEEATGTPPETQTQEAPPPPRVESVRMKGRAPVGEPKTFEYEKGDTIRLRFTSDVAEEVHVHGFDEYVDVPAGGTPKVARFKANLEGIFEVEAHSSGEMLARLEIRPK